MKKVWGVYTYAGEENTDLMLDKSFKYKKDAKRYAFEEMLERGLNEHEVEITQHEIHESYKPVWTDKELIDEYGKDLVEDVRGMIKIK